MQVNSAMWRAQQKSCFNFSSWVLHYAPPAPGLVQISHIMFITLTNFLLVNAFALCIYVTIYQKLMFGNN